MDPGDLYAERVRYSAYRSRTGLAASDDVDMNAREITSRIEADDLVFSTLQSRRHDMITDVRRRNLRRDSTRTERQTGDEYCGDVLRSVLHVYIIMRRNLEITG